MSLLPQDPMHEHFDKDGFRLRGTSVGRIDAFSDVVFGFVLTLLVVSLEVPKTYAQLHASLRGFVPFGVCFFFLMMIWHSHYKYFRRFGTHDLNTIVINGFLLFVVLFYVYPLKVLFTAATYSWMKVSNGFFDTPEQLTELMLLYGVGYAAIHLLIGALYWNGYRQRVELKLTPREQALTRGYIAQEALVGAVGVISCGVALLLPARLAGSAGWAYLLVWVARRLSNSYNRRQLGWLKEQLGHVEISHQAV